MREISTIIIIIIIIILIYGELGSVGLVQQKLSFLRLGPHNPFYFLFRDRHQVSLRMLREFKRIN